MNEPSRFQTWKARVRHPLLILAAFIGFLWLAEIVDVLLFDQALNQLGVTPRSLSGVWGVLLMPLLHDGLSHVAANTVPLAILGGLILLRDPRDFVLVTLITMLVTGLGLWVLGRPGVVYIGASGLVFGYFGFLLLRAWFDRRWDSLLVAVLVFIFYGGLFWGILPSQRPGVSSGAHFLGLVGGILSAWVLTRSDNADSGHAGHSEVDENNIHDRIRIVDRDI